MSPTIEDIKAAHQRYIQKVKHWNSADQDCWLDFALAMVKEFEEAPIITGRDAVKSLHDKATDDYIVHGSMIIEVKPNTDPLNPDTVVMRHIPWMEFVKK